MSTVSERVHRLIDDNEFEEAYMVVAERLLDIHADVRRMIRVLDMTGLRMDDPTGEQKQVLRDMAEDLDRYPET